MSERINKTSICSVVFLDIIDYSKMSVSEQSDLKEHFNALISEAIKDLAQNDRIILDTGDGAAISILGAPEEALFVSMTIRDNILKHNKQTADQPLFVRIGINLGPVRLVSDINGQPNIIGDGINVAQRVMSFAEPNQILVSRSYYEVTSRLTKEITGMFTYSGIKHDKHVREHEVYVIRPSNEDSASEEAPASTDTIKDIMDSTDAAETAPLSKKGWIILAGLLVGLVGATFYWSASMRAPKPAIEMSAPSPVVMPATPSTATGAVTAPPVNSATVDTKEQSEPKKKSTKHKKAKSTESDKAIKPAETSVKDTHSTGSNKDTKPASPHHTDVIQAKPAEKPKEKSVWDSVKQGGKNECTQGEIAMGQCK